MSEQEPNDNNLIGFIATTVETMRDQMAKKADLAMIERQVATKDDLARLESKLDVGLPTIHGDFEQVHLRFDTIDRTLSTRMGQIETEVSRLRSVVYLLVKDKARHAATFGPVVAGW